MDSYFLDEEESFEGESLDLKRYYKALLKRWWLIGLITVVVTAPWVIYLKSQPPVYEAKALIRFKDFAGQDIVLMQSRTTELTSRSFAENVVAQLGLTLRIEMQGLNDEFLNRSKIFKEFSTTKNPIPGNYILRFKPEQSYTLSILHEDFQTESVIKNGYIQDIIENDCQVNGLTFKIVPEYLYLPSELYFEVISFRSAVKSFQSRIVVNWEDRAGTLMNLTLSDSDPVVVAEMTNRLAEIFIQESSGIKRERGQGRVKILKEQLEEAENELRTSDLKLKKFKEDYEVNLEAEDENKVEKAANLEEEKRKIETTINTLNDLLIKKEEETLSGSIEDNKKTTLRIIMAQIAEQPVFDNNATMLVSRMRLGNLEENWNDIVTSTSAENLKAKKILNEILQAHIPIETIARQEIKKLNRELVTLDSDITEAKRRIKDLPAQQRKLNELTRENKVLATQYEGLLAKYQEAIVSEAAETEDIQILDPAIPPELPTNSDKKKKAAMGGIMGLFMGMGLVIVIEFMNKTITSAEDVKKHLRLPILGTIPQIDFQNTFDFQDSEKIKQIDQQLVTHDYSPTPIGEAYRSLRTNLMFTKQNGKTRSLAITSNEPGDGKSFTAANLSITLAQLKSSTLLIDSDLRRGVLHNTFGIPKEPGFSNYLTDVVPLQSIIHETQIPNLSVISCGSLIPNPSELLASHQMQRFLDEVRRKFDLIVFDTPPLNAATDAVVVGTQIDAVVIVVRAGKTHRDLAKSKLELFSSVPAKVLGVVLNGTTTDMAHPGYSYYHY